MTSPEWDCPPLNPLEVGGRIEDVSNIGGRLEFIILPGEFVIFVAFAILLAFRYIDRFWVVGLVVRIREDAIEFGPEKEGVVRKRCFGL